MSYSEHIEYQSFLSIMA